MQNKAKFPSNEHIALEYCVLISEPDFSNTPAVGSCILGSQENPEYLRSGGSIYGIPYAWKATTWFPKCDQDAADGGD